MDITIDDLPMVIYTCFVLNNYCEINKVCVHDELVSSSVLYERDFQPAIAANKYIMEKNEAKGKSVRNMLAMHFDP